MLSEDLRIVEARVRVNGCYSTDSIAPANVLAILAAALGPADAKAAIAASDPAARLAARYEASRHIGEDSIVLLATVKRLTNAIYRALGACPFCHDETCTAEAHTWLKEASGWRPGPH